MSKKVAFHCVIIFAISIILTFVNDKIKILCIPNAKDMNSYLFNLFTVSTIFAGFLFTSMGLLLSVCTEQIIRKFEGTDILLSKIRSIINGIIFFCIAGIIALISIAGIFSRISVLSDFFYISVLMNIAFGIYWFVVSTYNVYQFILRVFKCENKKSKGTLVDEFNQYAAKAREKLDNNI